MPKGNNIKWRREDSKEVANAVRQFNAKITRTLKKHPELAEYLPERITTAEVREKISSRKDFNREIKSLKRFLKKGAEMPVNTEKGIKTTRWEKKEVSIKVATINRARTRQRKLADVTTEKGTMGSIEANNLNPKPFNIDKMSEKDWEKYKETVEKQVASDYYDEKNEQYYENYLRGFRDMFGELGESAYNRIAKIPPNTLAELYHQEPVLQLEFYYGAEPMMFKLNAIENKLSELGY